MNLGTGICTVCGEGRRPVLESQRCVDGVPRQDLGARKVGGYQTEPSGIGNWRFTTERQITGEACACDSACRECMWTSSSCRNLRVDTGERCCSECNHEPTAPTRPATILDPFGGTGTTALVAKALGRHGITVDISADYCRLAQWRTNDRDQLAKVLGIDKAPPVPDDQLSIFDMEETA